ncbi:MAG: type II CAAX endopeptidase family protein [Bryobacteraceae bacterium]
MTGLSPNNNGAKILALAPKLALFIAIAGAAHVLLPERITPIAGLLVSSALTVFAAGAIANELSVYLWEQGKLSDFGLGWNAKSARNTFLGIACGLGAAAAIVLFSLAARFAVYEALPDQPANLPNMAFVAFVLIFGAAGEEMLFHGYAFQAQRKAMGDFAAILPVAVIFGVVHMGNANVSILGIVNTVLWGVLLGWSYVLTEGLWLPIGLHFGWNLGLMIFGVNLSGFTIGVVGYELHWNRGDLYSGGAYGLEGSFLTTIAVAALFYAVFYAVKRANPEEVPGETGGV